MPKSFALNSAIGGFVGQQRGATIKRVYTLEELKAKGFRVVKWDGRTPLAILDHQGRIVVMLAGRPSDPGWDGVIEEATSLFMAAKAKFDAQGEDIEHRRGHFVALRCGVSFGGGQTVRILLPVAFFVLTCLSSPATFRTRLGSKTLWMGSYRVKQSSA